MKMATHALFRYYKGYCLASAIGDLLQNNIAVTANEVKENMTFTILITHTLNCLRTVLTLLR